MRANSRAKMVCFCATSPWRDRDEWLDAAVVLAAGKGTRMKSELPKVLVAVCGRPMIDYVLDALEPPASSGRSSSSATGPTTSAERWPVATGVDFVLQAEQRGTGHAVMMCREPLAGHDGPVVVVAGDSPLMQADSLAGAAGRFEHRPAACILAPAHKDDPPGWAASFAMRRELSPASSKRKTPRPSKDESQKST